MEYRRVREAWLREITSEELEDLPPSFLDEIRDAISRIREELDGPRVPEPRRSLLAGELVQLETFHDQIAQSRLVKILSKPALGLDPGTRDPEELGLIEGVKELVSPYMERFYRIPEENLPVSSPAENPPEPAMTEPMAVRGEGPVVGPKVARKTEPAKSRNHVLRILKNFPRFVGPDLKTYGPFAKEDVVALPDDISGILVSRRSAEGVGTGDEDT